MTSRFAQARNICLQCQTRLLSGPNPGRILQIRPAPFITHHRHERLYSSDSVWKRLLAESEPKKTETKDKKQGNNKSRGHKPSPRQHHEPPSETWKEPDAPTPTPTPAPAPTPTTLSAAQENIKITFEDAPHHEYQEKPPPGVREPGHRGRIGSRRVVLQPEGLGIDMLGQQAHTIVMRDDFKTKPRREIQEDPTPEPITEGAAAEIQAFLEAAEGEPSPEEAYNNIDELRPQSRLIPRNDFWSLHRDLSEGFTNRQLSDYIVKERRKQKGAATLLSATAKRPAQPWMAGSYTIRPLEEIDVISIMNPKQRRAVALMMDSWKLDIWERVEGISETTVTVKDPAVAIVLNAGGQRNQRLEAMRTDFLQAGETLSWVSETNILHIVARRTIVETIITEVGRITDSIAEETIALLPSSTAKDQLPTVEPVIDQLCRLTNAAHVLESAAGRRGNARIMWVKDAAAEDDDGLEEMGHIVWRLLYTAYAKPQSTVAVPQDLAKTLPGRLDLDTRHEEKLPWKDRQRNWARWVLPVHRENEGLDQVDGITSSMQALVIPSPTQRLEAEDALWTPSETSISTTFGHVLFEVPGDENTTAAVVGSLSSGTPVAHTLTSVVPPPGSLAPLDSLMSENSAITTIVFRFAAGPNHTKTPLLGVNDGAVGLNSASQARYVVELHLEVPETAPEDGVLTWDASSRKSVRAVLETSDYDVPLPDRPVDLRITRLISSTLRDPDSIPSLRQFIDSSHLDLSSGSLRTPSTLNVPADALAGLPVDSDSKKTRKTESLEFLGLEVRRATQFPYQGHSLSYTSVEAGLHGGRRAEFSLGLSHAAAEATEAEESAHRQRYLDLAMSLADGRLVHWGDGPHGVTGQQEEQAVGYEEETNAKEETDVREETEAKERQEVRDEAEVKEEPEAKEDEHQRRPEDVGNLGEEGRNPRQPGE